MTEDIFKKQHPDPRVGTLFNMVSSLINTKGNREGEF